MFVLIVEVVAVAYLINSAASATFQALQAKLLVGDEKKNRARLYVFACTLLAGATGLVVLAHAFQSIQVIVRTIEIPFPGIGYSARPQIAIVQAAALTTTILSFSICETIVRSVLANPTPFATPRKGDLPPAVHFMPRAVQTFTMMSFPVTMFKIVAVPVPPQALLLRALLPVLMAVQIGLAIRSLRFTSNTKAATLVGFGTAAFALMSLVILA